MLRVVIMAFCVGMILPGASSQTRMQMTDVDEIATRLQSSAGKDDMIVVVPWYFGVSFHRYYSGLAPWMTVPPLEDHSIHHYEAVKDWMMKPDQVEPVRSVLAGIERTLKSGHRVWVVGGPDFKLPLRAPALLPAAPGGPSGWWQWPYYQCWSAQVGHALQIHGQHNVRVALTTDVPVRELENLQLVLVEGWQDQ